MSTCGVIAHELHQATNLIPLHKASLSRSVQLCMPLLLDVNNLTSYVCSSCTGLIVDRYMLQVEDKFYHLDCLRCASCQKSLGSDRSCFVKNNNVYCKQDYVTLFGTKCSKCCRSIAATDWVRRARECVYHLACFACDTCKRQLSTGEEFTLLTTDEETRLLCKTHYIDSVEGSSSRIKDDGSDSSSSSTGKPKTKRMRTTFTDEQLQVLQANFNMDSNPDGQDLERIAQMTGLSKRVTQVWFQNSRARQKKHQQQSQRKMHAKQNNPHSVSRQQMDSSVGVQLSQILANSPSPNSMSNDNADSSSQDYSISSFM
ncbi:LIM/homeobox protein Awh-like isoform X2 [Paramacrobiotus metropolitanus]|uniref:LIM/homeobox protein Awh-like isoform X2 n=1 Tax=Paramacrobiotus metropolitanus TaxID=2943436 RepID=UPI00244650DD|nr:LIM/homeobox protein Awh-like isoform X2 [Paramacrobiotus metropolitanus]